MEIFMFFFFYCKMCHLNNLIHLPSEICNKRSPLILLLWRVYAGGAWNEAMCWIMHSGKREKVKFQRRGKETMGMFITCTGGRGGWKKKKEKSVAQLFVWHTKMLRDLGLQVISISSFHICIQSGFASSIRKFVLIWWLFSNSFRS